MLEYALTIERIDAFAARFPVHFPVHTSFGTMHNRPAVFVRIEDKSGCFGWGEAFANWPAAGAEHRVNLLIDDVSDLVLGECFSGPQAMFDQLTSVTQIRALQCGEPGPFAQVIAALDIAAWDLVARRSHLPLAQLIARGAPNEVPAYASGIHIDAAEEEITKARAGGHRAFKVKVGFDPEAEPEKLSRIVMGLSPGELLFADANQGFDIDQAARFLDETATLGLGWLEEPIIATAHETDWQRLQNIGAPLAGGENIADAAEFDAVTALGTLRFIQPDVTKWGGITGCLRVARRALKARRTYCPHFLGGGVGLAASAHVLAAVGGGGSLEVDVNENPLRSAFRSLRIEKGHLSLDSAPGLGITILPKVVLDNVTHQRTLSKNS